MEPETQSSLPEYTGTQAGAIVEPEQVAPLPEYTGNTEQVKPEAPTENQKKKIQKNT